MRSRKISPTILAALLALASPLAAKPVASSATPGGVAIPLFKRAGLALADDDGIVDWQAAQAHLARLWVKYQKGMVAYQENQGDRLLGARALSKRELDDHHAEFARRAEWSAANMPAYDEDMVAVERAFMARANAFELNPTASIGNPKVSNPKTRTKKSAGVGLTMYGNDLLWAGPVTIGTPGSSFVLDFDTGSADLWVPSVNCTIAACAPHAKYNPSTSSTAVQKVGSSLNLVYGDGSATKGDVWADTVSVAGITATGQALGSANSLSSDFGDDPMDGILGMGFQSISQMNAQPFFQTLVAQGKVPLGQFSFKLAETGSELYLGGTNPAHYTGDLEWHSITSESYWVLNANVASNGTVGVSGVSMIVDTGTTVIVAPTGDALALWSRVPGAASYSNGYYTFPCDAVPSISFQFDNGKQWTMAPEDLNLGLLAPGSQRCVGSIVGQDVGMSAWILGDAFLKNVYSVFDVDHKRVGFATPT